MDLLLDSKKYSTLHYFAGGTIISSIGYRVVLSERFRLSYEERSGLAISVEYESVPGTIIVFHDSMCFLESGKQVDIDLELDRKVFSNITRSLEWRGFDVTVVGTELQSSPGHKQIGF